MTRGGPDDPALTRPAHARCNYWKRTRDAVEVLDEVRPDLLERLALPTG